MGVAGLGVLQIAGGDGDSACRVSVDSEAPLHGGELQSDPSRGSFKLSQ